MIARRLLLVLLSLCALAGIAPANAAVVGGQYRYWSFTDGNDLRDPLLYLSAGPLHAQIEFWDPLRGEGQLRPEFGLHVRDSRHSSYSVTWRHERAQERLWLGTEQVAAHGLVARATVGPIWPDGGRKPSIVLDAGVDRYWGDWSFAGATIIHDPREGGLWAAPLRARLATQRNDWLQLTLVPASRRSFGWALDLKRGFIRGGVERNSRFDFTARDNLILTIGFEAPFPSGRQGAD